MDEIPTDLEILEDIYFRYHDEFRSYAKKEPDRIARIRVPVDIKEIAKACGVGEDMIFGRIYYHFNKKYSYKDSQGEITSFLATEKFEGLSVNFTLVAAVLADKYAEKKEHDTFMILSGTAIGISVISLLIAFFV